MKTRILSLALTAVLMISVIPLSSCGGSKKPPKSKVDHVYKATELELGENVSPTSLITTKDGVTVYASEVLNADTEKREIQNILINIDKATGESEKIVLGKSDSANGYIQNIASAPDGAIILQRQKYDQEKQTTSFPLERFTGSSSEVLCPDLSAFFTTQPDQRFYVRGFAVDKDGNYCVSTNDAVALFDSSFNKLFEVEVSNSQRLGSTSDGRVYVSCYDNTTERNVIKFIDSEKKALGDEVRIPDLRNIYNISFYAGPGYDIYYKDGEALYGFNSTDEAPTLLMNFVNSDVDPNIVQDIAIIDADNVVLYTRDFYSDTRSTSVLSMKRIPDDEIPEKYIIKFLYSSYSGDSVTSNVIKFNRASNEYRVELVDYSKYAVDNDNGVGQLERDLLAGTAPDIILTNYTQFDNWVEQGAFTDLNKLIEKDKAFDRSKYFESVLDAYTDDKGRMYQFVTAFMLGTIVADKKYVDFDSWNSAKFVDFASSLPKDKFLAEYIDRQTMLYMALACSMDSFIDYDKATCSFDGDSFRKVLGFVKSVPEEMISYYSTLSGDDLADYRNDIAKPYRDGKIMIYSPYIYRFIDYLQATVQFGEGEEVVFLGYPTNHGNGAIVRPRTSFAINDKSLVKDGAWEFIKFVADAGSSSRNNYFPISVASFDKQVDKEIGEWYFLSFNGTGSYGKDTTYEEVKKRVLDNAKRFGDSAEGVILQVTEEHRQGLKDLIAGAQSMPSLESKIFEIINEEAAMYYSDAKSLDETVKVIQNRVSTYISERK